MGVLLNWEAGNGQRRTRDGHNLYCGDDARKIFPNIKKLIEREQAAGPEVFFIGDNHDPDDLEFQTYPADIQKEKRNDHV